MFCCQCRYSVEVVTAFPPHWSQGQWTCLYDKWSQWQTQIASLNHCFALRFLLPEQWASSIFPLAAQIRNEIEYTRNQSHKLNFPLWYSVDVGTAFPQHWSHGQCTCLYAKSSQWVTEISCPCQPFDVCFLFREHALRWRFGGLRFSSQTRRAAGQGERRPRVRGWVR